MKRVQLVRFERNTMTPDSWVVGFLVELDSGQVVHPVDTILEVDVGSKDKDALVEHAMHRLLPPLEAAERGPMEPEEMNVKRVLGEHKHGK